MRKRHTNLREERLRFVLALIIVMLLLAIIFIYYDEGEKTNEKYRPTSVGNRR